MAEIAPQHIVLIEQLLKELGYDLTGHENGKNDESFQNAFSVAEQDLLKLAGSTASHLQDDMPTFDGLINNLQSELNQDQETKTNILALKTAGAFRDDVSAMLPQEILDQLIPINPNLAKNFEHLIEFTEKYDQYRPAILATEAALYPAQQPTPDADTAEQQNTADTDQTNNNSLLQNITVSQAELDTAEALDPEKIRALQQSLISQGLELTANGTWDNATKTAYLNSILAATDNKEALTDIEQSSNILQTRQQELLNIHKGLMEQQVVIDNDIATYKEQYDWGWTDGTWFDSHDIDNEEIDTKIAALEAQKSALTEQANQIALVTNSWQQSLIHMNGELKPLLTATHASDELKQTINPAPLNNETNINTDSEATQEPSGAAAIIEGLLGNPALQKTIEDAAKMLGDTDFKLSQPINTGDGIIDAGSDAGLQQVLSFLVSDVAAGLKHYQSTTNEPTTYTPALGHALAQALQDPNHPNAAALSEINKTLNEAFTEQGLGDLEDPENPGQKISSIDFLTIQLNELYRKKALKREAIQDLDLINAQMDPIQMGILNFVVNFIPPEMIAALDGIIRQFTGGHGILDLMPQLKAVDSLNEALGGMDDLDPTQRLAESFKRSFKNVDDAADRESMKDSLVEATAMIENLPFGSGERRQNFPIAVEAALSDAMAAMGDIKPGDPDFEAKLSEASLVYADSFEKNMHELSQKYGGADRLANPAITINEKVLMPTLSQSGFDIDGQGGDVGSDEINRVVAAYNNANQGLAPHNQNPLIFTDNNGQTYTAGISQPSNTFTIEHLPIADISTALANGASQEALSQTYTGYALLSTTYQYSFHGYMKSHDVTFDNTIITAASDPSVSKPFSAIEHGAQIHSQSQTMRQDLENAFMDADERARLERDLAGAIVNSRSRAARDGDHPSRINAGVSRPNVDPKTAELIALREMAQDDDKSREVLATQPKTYTGLKGNIYLFSKIADENQGGIYQRAFEVDATEEIARYTALTADKMAFYQKDSALMKAHFPNLSTVASQYPQHTNAFSLAQSLASQNSMEFKPAPLVNNLPTWLHPQVRDSQSYNDLSAQTANKPQIIFDRNDPNAIRLVAKGDENRTFIGHDVSEELNRFRTLTDEQKQSIFTNTGQASALFPRMSELAGQYDAFSAKVLAQSLLARADIQDHLGATADQTVENATELRQHM